MGIKAYRVLEAVTIKAPSFDLGFDDKLVEYLADKFDFFVMLDDDGIGFAVLPVEALQSALLNVTMTEETHEHLKNDIVLGKKTGWVRYMFT